MDYLQLVNGSFRVRVVVPVALRGVLGKSTLVKTLNTANYTIANRLAEPYIAEFKSRIERVGKLSLADTSERRHYHNNIKPRHFNGTDAASDSPEWYTPPKVFEALEIKFDMDVASPGAHIVDWIPANRHLTKTEDGLTTPWDGTVWCNPPYGLRNGMQKWIDKFISHGNGIIMLPGYTYSKWFHDLVPQVDCILFTLFKLHFINPNIEPERKNCTLGNFLAAIGDNGITGLGNAAANGLGKIFTLVS